RRQWWSSAPRLQRERRAQPRAEASALRPASASFRPVSFPAPPLSGDREQNAQLAVARRCEARRRLHHELIDKQKRHAGLDIVKQPLQARLVDVTACDGGDESGLGL